MILAGCAGSGPAVEPAITDAAGDTGGTVFGVSGKADASASGDLEDATASPEVRQLLATGRAHLDASRWEDAAATFRQVLALDRYNPAARAGLSDAIAYLNEGSTLDSVASDIQLRREAAFAQFQSAVVRAGEASDKGRYDYAKGMLLTALATLNRERTFLSVNEYESRRSQAMRLIDDLDRRARLAAQAEAAAALR